MNHKKWVLLYFKSNADIYGDFYEKDNSNSLGYAYDI